MTKAEARRYEKVRSLTSLVEHFDMGNPVHRAHYLALRKVYGDLGAIMLVSQDVAEAKEAAAVSHNPELANWLALTDPGEIASHPGWRQRNRVVRHGEEARYWIIDPEDETKAGGRITAMFTRAQTVPAFAQPE